MSFAEAALQLADKEARRRIKNTTRPTSDANVDAGELRRPVKGADGSKLLLEKSGDGALGAEGSAKNNFIATRDSLASRGVLYKKEFLAAVRRQTTMGLSAGVFFGSPNAPKLVSILLLLCKGTVQRGLQARE